MVAGVTGASVCADQGPRDCCARGEVAPPGGSSASVEPSSEASRSLYKSSSLPGSGWTQLRGTLRPLQGVTTDGGRRFGGGPGARGQLVQPHRPGVKASAVKAARLGVPTVAQWDPRRLQHQDVGSIPDPAQWVEIPSVSTAVM